VLFARLPVPGKAKTRLAKDVGPDAAADLYRRMAERAFAATACSSRAASRTLCFSEASEAEGIQRWVEAMGDTSLRLAPQCASPDLGERMRHALTRALERGGEGGGPCAKAIVVGTDVPDLSAAHVDAAAAALDDHDVVFGPAVDGGYYLLGVRRPVAVARAGGDAGVEGGGDAEAATGAGEGLESEKALVSPRLFRGVPWSTETVLRDSLEDVHAWVANMGEAPNAAGNDDAFLAAARALCRDGSGQL
jgi:rSAM/selenodomain-associated transferase 1